MNTELKQGSDDWFAMRIGNVTGSTVGAILGVSPLRKRDDIMRSMVREFNGSLSEFIGNIATEYGIRNEHLARVDYELNGFGKVTGTGFHKFEDWLGASPDGLVGADGLIEIKCPYSMRDIKKPIFKTIDEQPHYYAQIQIQLLVTGRKWCDFVQWNRHDFSVTRVEVSTDWLNENLPKLRRFYDDYLIERTAPHCEKHLKARHETIENEMIQHRVEEYISLKKEIKARQALVDLLLDQIISDCKENESLINGHKLTHVHCKKVSYSRALNDLLPDADLSEYETVSSYWKLT